MDIISKIVGISVGLLILVGMFPTAAETFFAVDTANWTATAVLMWNLIPVFVFVGLGLMFLAYVKVKRGRTD